ncbi:MAG: SPFH domain-containing protein [Gemmataceae bacterium]|nr:SPFH domain-containing protein [Gemmataceae bacterium]MCS7270329.1 SPFH domain-containing protein [Gemmataceae bacterium]MDW8243165.1 SPFH domain-containing protein [Thermogemmata sp.]
MPRLLLLTVVVSVLIWLCSGWTIIRPGERAVVQRLGAIVAHPAPGLWLGLPWGIDRVHRFPVNTVRQLSVGFNPYREDAEGSLFLTADHNLVQLELVVHYSIGETDIDLDAYFLQQEQTEAILARLTESLVAQWIAAHDIDYVLLQGNGALPLWLTDSLVEQLAPYGLGVRVQQVHVAGLAPPPEVRPAFAAVTQAQTHMGTQLSQARQQAEQRLRQAHAIAYRKEQEAFASQYALRRQAQADINEFHTLRSAIGQAPQRLALYWWQEMHRSLTSLKNRGGRIEPVDPSLGPNGLDLTQLLRLRHTEPK